jgi:hypothetical protein
MNYFQSFNLAQQTLVLFSRHVDVPPCVGGKKMGQIGERLCQSYGLGTELTKQWVVISCIMLKSLFKIA